MDLCTGLVGVKGMKSYLNLIDLYTGFSIPIALKSETSGEIARLLDENLIKVFGPPLEISSDNASNLSGPEIKNLFSFYGIIHRTTVPYSPTSHSLVEICNRYITQLVRIFSDQYQSHWPNVLTLAAIIYNSVPRVQLHNHSPHFLMFLEEPFKKNNLLSEKNLEYASFIKSTSNDRVYMKLIRERLLKIREKKNKEKSNKFISYPVGTLIFVRDLRPKLHKKLKPVYFKTPMKVISEYKNVVFAIDFLGKVKKLSKNNIRKAHDRTIELFSKLPDEIKLILGEEMNTEKWDEIKNTGKIPEYLADLEIEGEVGRQLRSFVPIPNDTHLIQPDVPLESNSSLDKALDNTVNLDEEVLEELVSDKGLEMINTLHSAELLNDENITLQDVPRLLRSKNKMPVEDYGNLDYDIANEIIPVLVTEENRVQDPAAVDVRNILPENSRRTRRVRYNLPKLI